MSNNRIPKFKVRIKLSPNKVHIPKSVYNRDRREEQEIIEQELKEYEADLKEELSYGDLYWK